MTKTKFPILDQKEVDPRPGIIRTAGDSNTFRIAWLRYVLSFTANRNGPTEIAGIAIFRNTGEGSIAKEVYFVWEPELKNVYIEESRRGKSVPFCMRNVW